MTADIPDFVAHSSRSRIALLALGSVVFIVIGLWMVGAFGAPPVSRRYPVPVIFGIGWFSILFFGACGVAWIKKLFNTGEELRIGSGGIHWARWSSQTIPWSEVRDVSEWSFKGHRSIVLHLHNAALFPGRGIPAWTAKANRALTGGDISLDLTATNRTVDEAMAAIHRFRSTQYDRLRA